MKRYPRTNPGPFAIGPSGNRTCDPPPPHFTSRGNHQILSQKCTSICVSTSLAGSSRRRNNYTCPAPLRQPPVTFADYYLSANIEFRNKACTRGKYYSFTELYFVLLIFIYVYRRCLLYTSPSPRDQRGSRMPSSA